MEGVEGAASLPLVRHRWRLLILSWVRAIMRKVTRSTAVVADDLALRSLLVITIGAWWQGGEIGDMLAWSVLLPGASLPVRRSSAIVPRFPLQLQGEDHYVIDLGGGHCLLLGLDKLTNVRLQAVHEGMHLVRLQQFW